MIVHMLTVVVQELGNGLLVFDLLQLLLQVGEYLLSRGK